MTRTCEKFNKKNLPYGSCKKKKKIGYFPTLGGGGGVSDKVGKFQLFFFFFFEPFPKTHKEESTVFLRQLELGLTSTYCTT